MIDITCDFTSERYWEGFWDRDPVKGSGGEDPDSASRILREYHRELWSRKLPNGEVMELDEYLQWNGIKFASDSITCSFRYERFNEKFLTLSKVIPGWREYIERFLRESYTLGGCIIFPKHPGSINQCRGTSKVIMDRFDLTLECIRRFYLGQESPLSSCLERDRGFFEKFVDFRGYVDFFFLQDLVSEDYSAVIPFYGDFSFGPNEFPEDYCAFLDRQIAWIRKSNARIEAFCRAVDRIFHFQSSPS